ncbi:hypothetical protein [Azotobacter chroococcum]|uniref:Uncharacterized protein n=1 Tax=Azotobacter chroococcum TaxID=353 RepID=A0AAP9YCV5_9GAMM|nr:hypothetical protein [Azotobacter chroococcum]QQE88537.1 hypothetical protein GKQ51_20265 [Azotobacter chroococcum]
MTQPSTSTPAFELLPPSARALAVLIGEAEALRIISRACEDARRNLAIRHAVKAAQQNGHGVSVTVGRLAFVHGLPTCCVWRIAEAHAPALGECQP